MKTPPMNGSRSSCLIQTATVAMAPRPEPSSEDSSFLDKPQGPGELGRLGPFRVLEVIGSGATAATIVAVGGVTRLVLPGLSWAPALAFAAAVAPTDAVAATSVLTRLGAPQRVVTILEGEGLINDAVALTAFGLAVEAMAHPFTLGHAVARTAEGVLGGGAPGHDEDTGADNRPDAERGQPDRAEDAAQAVFALHLLVEHLQGFGLKEVLPGHEGSSGNSVQRVYSSRSA